MLPFALRCKLEEQRREVAGVRGTWQAMLNKSRNTRHVHGESSSDTLSMDRRIRRSCHLYPFLLRAFWFDGLALTSTPCPLRRCGLVVGSVARSDPQRTRDGTEFVMRYVFLGTALVTALV